MIKFLRKIRQKLLAENKFSKYLIYAIGEIALVVIGILIAVNINNWNENIKNENLVKSYKQNLIENLTQDSLNISEVLFDLNNDIKKIEEYEYNVSNSAEPFELILKIARYEYEFKISIISDYENDTYKVLNSTGHLSLFKNEIVKELNELYNLEENAIFVTNTTMENYISSLSHYSRKYPFSFRNNLIQNGTVAGDKVWGNISLSDHATEFNALIIAKSDSYRLSLQYLPLIKTKINKLLEILHEENH